MSEIKDLSSLHKYRTEIPNIIFHLGLDPYELATYCALKKNHDENKEFGLSVSDLAQNKISDTKIRQILNKLLFIKLIEEIYISKEKVVYFLCQKIPQKLSIGEKICEWCQCNSCILHKHHYPIPQSDGGKICVTICPNCHYEYHELLETARFRILGGE